MSPPAPGADTLRRDLALGAAIAGAFALLNVAMNGTLPDEVVRWAQILTGAVKYPAGHPHDTFYRTAFSLLGYATAGLLAVVRSTDRVNGIINALYLFMSAFVPFATALVLARQVRWACVAMALAMAGAMLPFAGRYPLLAYPEFHANGHVGTHLAVLAVVLVVGGLWRPAGLVLGLLPGVHAVMAAAVWPWALLYLLRASARPTGRERAVLLRWLAAGLAVCIALGIAILIQDIPPALPPYAENPDAALVYRNFTATSDYHRRLLNPWSMAYLVNPVAIVVLCLLLLDERSGPGTVTDAKRARIGWILAFAAMVWAAIYGAYALQVVGLTPRPLQMAMPNRFSNLTAILLMPLTAAALARGANALSGWRASAAHLLVITLLAGVFLRLHERAATPQYGIAVAWGLSCAWLLLAGRARRAIAAAVVLSLAFAIAPNGRDSAPAVILGFLVALGVTWVAGRLPERATLVPARPRERWWAAAVAAAACVVCLGGVRWLGGARPLGAWLEMSEDDRRLNGWLAANAASDEPLLPFGTLQSALQVKTGHPIVFEWETLYLMTYQPDLAGTLNTMVIDLYGVDFRRIDALRTSCPQNAFISQWCRVWQDAWTGRTMGQWQEAGRKYGFRLVLAPTRMPLHLPLAVSGVYYNLYTIPPVSPTTHQP